ncbi:MAG: hypothetical protein R3D51_14080 [Hyphomicrobiaceae bacterium]
MSSSQLCLRIPAAVLGAFVMLSPHVVATGPVAHAVGKLDPEAFALPLSGNKLFSHKSSGFVTTATIELDLRRLGTADFGDETR